MQQKTTRYFIPFLVVLPLFFQACSTSVITTTPSELPQVYEDINETYQKKHDIRIVLFRLNNYTDTPRAGMRAANILKGLLQAKGYIVKDYIKEKTPSFKKAKKKAKETNSDYFFYGGVSEWRYKTGIDGEPAVSLQIGLYKSKNGKLVWSATGSQSEWGNDSIGTTAHELLKEMIQE